MFKPCQSRKCCYDKLTFNKSIFALDMLGIQTLFDEQVLSFATPEKLGLLLISRKLEERGITLTDKQKKALRKQLSNCLDKGSISFNFDDNQVAAAGFSSEEELKPVLQAIMDSLVVDVEKFAEHFGDVLPETINVIVEDVSMILLGSLKDRASRMLKDNQKLLNKFVTNLDKLWGNAFDLLEMQIVIALEAGAYVNKTYRPAASNDSDFVFEVLTRLHARACQISWEILTLLKNGFADGAHARWRALHEISVVGSFISNHGNDVAERYLLHHNVESYKAAIQYQEYCDQLGMEPFSQEEMTELCEQHNALITRFGDGYKNDHGWASKALNISKPTFRDIEAKVELDHLRPYYKMASHNVHANSKGIFFRLGLVASDENLLLAGPSNVGLTDPGQLLGLSLTQITTTLLTHKSTIDSLVISKTMLNLQGEVAESLSLVEKSIESK